MDDIDECIQNISNKIAKLNNFIALSLRRNNIPGELDKLSNNAIQVRDLLTEAHELMQKEANALKDDYEVVMSQMRRKQMIIMNYLIKEKQKKVDELEEEEINVNLMLSCGKKINASSAVSKPSVKGIGYLSKLNLNQALPVTPKIKISEYKESPLIKKKINALPFQFEEFDITIEQQQFDTIPKYMCGRETLDQLNSFLQTVIIPCFNDKYKLIHKERSCLRNLNDIELWKLYNEQASYLPGRTFITPGDITRKLNKMMDKKTQNRLVMLRHIGVLNEVRLNQTVCYIWVHNASN